MTHKLTGLLFTALLQLTMCDVLYPWGSSHHDNITCSALHNSNYYPDQPFKVTSQRGLIFFGVKYTEFYVSPNGFVSDIAADGLSPGGKRKRFPLSGATSSTWDNCNTTADPNCWMNYYYDFAEWSSLVSRQTDGDVCVNGRTVSDNFEYDTSAWQSGTISSYTPITDSTGCVEVTNPVHNHPNWMIAVYWAEMEVVAHPATITFRETDDADILARVKADVESLHTVSSFDPLWAFVITWYSMTYPQGYQYQPFPTNSFQLVLATDAVNTYGIYNYNETQLGGGTVSYCLSHVTNTTMGRHGQLLS